MSRHSGWTNNHAANQHGYNKRRRLNWYRVAGVLCTVLCFTVASITLVYVLTALALLW